MKTFLVLSKTSVDARSVQIHLRHWTTKMHKKWLCRSCKKTMRSYYVHVRHIQHRTTPPTGYDELQTSPCTTLEPPRISTRRCISDLSQIWMMTEKCIDEITSNMSRNPVPFDCNSRLVRTPADEIDPDEILSPSAVPLCTSTGIPAISCYCCFYSGLLPEKSAQAVLFIMSVLDQQNTWDYIHVREDWKSFPKVTNADI